MHRLRVLHSRCGGMGSYSTTTNTATAGPEHLNAQQQLLLTFGPRVGDEMPRVAVSSDERMNRYSTRQSPPRAARLLRQRKHTTTTAGDGEVGCLSLQNRGGVPASRLLLCPEPRCLQFYLLHPPCKVLLRLVGCIEPFCLVIWQHVCCSTWWTSTHHQWTENWK